MYLLRRSAFKAVSASSSLSSISKPRSVATAATRFTLRPRQQWAVSPFQKRFATDDAAPPSAEKTTSETVPKPPSQSDAETLAESSATQPAEAASVTEAATEAPAQQNAETAAQEVATQTEPRSPNAFATSDSAQAAFAAAGAAAVRAPKPLRPKVMPGEPNPTVYVGNLYFEVNDNALRQHFEPFGKIRNVRIVYDHRGLSKGFGYVEFETAEEAGKAVETLDQTVFQGRRMAVQFHRQRERSILNRPRDAVHEPTRTLFIGNMSYDMSDRDLNDLFREVKNVTDVRVAIDRRTGQPRGFAHADFIDVESATKAMELLKTKEIYGRRLRLDYSKSSAMTRPQNRSPAEDQ